MASARSFNAVTLQSDTSRITNLQQRRQETGQIVISLIQRHDLPTGQPVDADQHQMRHRFAQYLL